MGNEKVQYKNTNIGIGRGGKKEYRTQHALIAERVLGRNLRAGEEIHHVDGDGKNNATSSLVICPSRSYHMLLHMRQRALNASGNADWLRCYFCKEYDAPENIWSYLPKKRVTPFTCHMACKREYERRR